MATKELGILIIITAIIIALMYAKMILIWKDVMLTKNEKIRKDMERLHNLKKNRHK
jgi:selenophosphate synthase